MTNKKSPGCPGLLVDSKLALPTVFQASGQTCSTGTFEVLVQQQAQVAAPNISLY